MRRIILCLISFLICWHCYPQFVFKEVDYSILQRSLERKEQRRIEADNLLNQLRSLCTETASLISPSESVMKDKPRDRNAFILNKPMLREIIGVGGFFFLMLLGMLYIFQHAEVNQLTDLLHLQLGAKGHVSTYELTLLFTTFVMTHFFYLFNARAFETGRSALHFKGCNGLLTIVAIILVGQIAMVELLGLQQFFNVECLKLIDWVIIIIGSSLVLWVREIWHLLTKK